MSTDYTRKTLGELLTDRDDIIKRNATSILKRLQRLAQQAACIHEWKITEPRDFYANYEACTRCGAIRPGCDTCQKPRTLCDCIK